MQKNPAALSSRRRAQAAMWHACVLEPRATWTSPCLHALAQDPTLPRTLHRVVPHSVHILQVVKVLHQGHEGLTVLGR